MNQFTLLKVYIQARNHYLNEQKKGRLPYYAGGAGVVFILLLVWLIFGIRSPYPREIYRLVPKDAIAVWDFYDAKEFLRNTTRSSFIKNFHTIPLFKNAERELELIEKLWPNTINDGTVEVPKDILASVHATSKNDFHFLFIKEIPAAYHSILIDSIKNIAKINELEHRERNFFDHPVYEIFKTPEKINYSYSIWDNYIFFSVSPFLIEETIRQVNDHESNFLKGKNYPKVDVTGIHKEDAKLWMHTNKLLDITEMFFKPFDSSETSWAREWRGLSVLDFSVKDRTLLMDGYTYPETTTKNYWDLFTEQKPTDSKKLYAYIPQRTALFYRIGLSNPSDFGGKLRAYWEEKGNIPFDCKKLEDDYGFDTKDFYEAILDEVAMCSLETFSTKDQNKLVFVKIGKLNSMEGILTRVNQNTSPPELKKPYQVQVGEWKIGKIHVKELPLTLFGKGFEGFNETFYTIVNSEYLVFSNTEEAIRNLHGDIEDELVWSKLVDKISFTEACSAQSNISFMASVPRCWSALEKNINSHWKEFLKQQKHSFIKVDHIGVQFAHLDKKWMTTVSVFEEKFNPQVGKSTDIEIISQSVFQKQVYGKPHIVMNENDKTYEALVQDETFKLFLVNIEGKQLWNIPINGRIIGNVQQINLLKNKALYYIFATDSKWYIMDRLGKVVSGFPKALPQGKQIAYLQVIDYDDSKNYRVLISSKDGNLFMYNTTGGLLNGWDPRPMISSLAAPPEHLRIDGKDIIVAIEKEGYIGLMKRNGQDYPKFPFNFDKLNFSNPLYIQQGLTFDKTILSTISNDGMWVSIDCNGKILNKKQLYHKSRNSKFSVCIDRVSESNVLIARQDDFEVSIMDTEGKALFTKNFKNSSYKSVQYYNFGAHVEVIVIIDTKDKTGYFYYPDGRQINTLPLDCIDEIGLIYSHKKKMFQVMRTHGNTYSLLQFEKG